MRAVCRECWLPIALRADCWVHADPIPPGRLRFWCRTEAGTLELIEPLEPIETAS